MSTIEVNKGNVQGLIVRGYTHPYSIHLLYAFPGHKNASAFVKALLPYLQSGEQWIKKPQTLLNIGLTFSGIRNSSPLSDAEFNAQMKPSTVFESGFVQGAASSGPQASLQDAGPSDPSKWAFGGPSTSAVDAVVHAYAMSQDELDQFAKIIAGAATAAGIKEIIPVVKGKEQRLIQYPLPNDTIHFGYHDGISEPDLDWPEKFPTPPTNTDPADLNNFLVGYPASAVDPGPSNPDAPYASAYGKDGCYNAFRVIYQDVQAFEKYLKDNAAAAAKALDKTDLAYAEEWIAAKLCGRWRNGSPLVLSPDMPDPETKDAKIFDYTKDTAGMKCPFAAHMRVANPRGEELVASEPSPPPRILRRGVPYGAPLGSPGFKDEQGLIGLFLCGSTTFQFELIYGWMNMNNFSDVFQPNYNTQDGLLGNRVTSRDNPVNRTFSIPVPGKKDPLKLPNLPPWLTTRGTLYCLLPSITTLKNIAAGK